MPELGSVWTLLMMIKKGLQKFILLHIKENLFSNTIYFYKLILIESSVLFKLTGLSIFCSESLSWVFRSLGPPGLDIIPMIGLVTKFHKCTGNIQKISSESDGKSDDNEFLEL